jgi:hypothetical protein
MSAKITSLLDLEKELQKNFAELEINFVPKQRPESIEVRKEAWGETTIHISLHPEWISMYGIVPVREKSDSYSPHPLPVDAQDCLNQIKALLEPSIQVVVHGPVTVGSRF